MVMDTTLHGTERLTDLHVELWCGASLRLEEDLVGLLVSKPHNLVLNGRAVPAVQQNSSRTTQGRGQ
jgi:hypothetical protein